MRVCVLSHQPPARYDPTRYARHGRSWHEHTLCSVPNLTRRDGKEFLQLAPSMQIRSETQGFLLEDTNEVSCSPSDVV